MRSRLAVLAVLCATALACDPLDRSEMTATFDDTGRRVTLSVSSDDRHFAVFHPNDMQQVVEDMFAGRDEWSQRFAQTKPQNERLVVNRTGGRIHDVETSGTFAAEDLQKFFFDSGITVQYQRGNGTVELAIYPGESTRASRKEIDTVKRTLERYSELTARYFGAVQRLYRYLDANDGRSAELFYAVVAGDKDEKPELTEREAELVDEVRGALMAFDEADPDHALGRMFDLVYNPFPGTLEVRIPVQPLEVEGFTATKGGGWRAVPADIAGAIAHLEGRWIYPDPLAAAERGDGKTPRQLADALAAEPRHMAQVERASDVSDAIEQELRPERVYRLKWTVTGDDPERKGSGTGE